MAVILVVEDHAMSRQMLKTLFGYGGHRVLEAADGTAALALARLENPDLIISDIVMPTMDGLQFIRLLRAEKGLDAIPVIFYTAAYRLPEAMLLAREMGECRVISKPSDPAVLLETIHEALGISPQITPATVADREGPGPARPDVMQRAGLQLATLMDLSFHLVGQRDPGRLLSTFAGACREMLNCRETFLEIAADHGRESCFSGQEKNGTANACRVNPFLLKEMSTFVRESRLPFRWTKEGNGGAEALLPRLSFSSQSIMALPFATTKKVYGWLCFVDKNDAPQFGVEDEEMAVALIAQGALAYENLLLIEELERRAAELRASEEKLHRALTTTGVQGWSWDIAAGRITFLGTSTTQRHSLSAQDFYLAVHSDDRGRLREAFENASRADAGADFNCEYRFKAASVPERWLLSRGVAVRDPAGKPLSLEGVNFDISERKLAEEKTKEHAGKLAELNEEMESFSYTIAHDLRAPLRAIDGYTNMILKKEGMQFNEETRRKFNMIRENAHTMGQLIEGLLAFSRLGRQTLSCKNLDMDALIQEAWQEQQAINPGRRITLKVGAIPSSIGDRTLIRQVFCNLFSNAVKFTRVREAPLIEVGAYQKESENIYYMKDNGIGFDVRYYDKLFGVFQRLHNVSDYEGTGIGLSLVQRVILRHGGRVWAEGEVDKGATFYFSIPVACPKTQSIAPVRQ